MNGIYMIESKNERHTVWFLESGKKTLVLDSPCHDEATKYVETKMEEDRAWKK